MPLIVVAFSMYTTHVFVPRYALWTVPGFAILVTGSLCWGTSRQPTVGISLLLLLVTVAGLRQVWQLQEPATLRSGATLARELAALADGDEPIVVADAQAFLDLSYYAQTRVRNRLIYPLSRQLDLDYLGFDTNALIMSALAHRSTLHIIPFEAVLAAHPRFVLASLSRDYMPRHLSGAGYRVEPISTSVPPALYRVSTATPGVTFR
jgi:hypothetical protein